MVFPLPPGRPRGSPVQYTKLPVNPVYCTGDPRGRPGGVARVGLRFLPRQKRPPLA